MEMTSLFSIGDKVKVVIPVKETEDPETFYYLKEFEHKVGVIQEIIPRPLQYRVLFGNTEAYLYENELTSYGGGR